MKRRMLLFLIILSSSYSSFSQKFHYAFNADFITSGNGHGAYYGLGAEIRHYRNAFSVMPMLQKSTLKLNAFQIGYSRLVTGVIPKKCSEMDECIDADFEMRVFASALYFHRVGFSKAILEMESSYEEFSSLYLQSLRMETAQLNVGFGGNKKLNPALMIRGYISFGYYYHANLTAVLYHEKSAPILNVGIGLGLLK